jgi:hypothetical protein
MSCSASRIELVGLDSLEVRTYFDVGWVHADDVGMLALGLVVP